MFSGAFLFRLMALDDILTGMTVISRDEIVRQAQLSNIIFDDQEIDALESDLERIFTNIEQLSELDTTEIEPTYQVNKLANVWREDVPKTEGPSRETLLELAPASRDASVEVPKVL